VNVRLSDFHVELLDAMQKTHDHLGVKISQAKIIEQALEYWVTSEPNMMAAVKEKMDVGFYFDV